VDVDLLGTGYSDATRPPPLHVDHVDSFLHRVATGGSILPPEQAEDGSVPSGPLQLQSDTPAPAGPHGYHSWELLFAGQDPTHALQVAPQVLHFASTSPEHAAECQAVRVTNHLPFKVTAALELPICGATEGSTRALPAWQVRPALQDIAPGAEAQFMVMFKPQAAGMRITQAVDVVAHAKYMRSFRLCNEVRIRVKL
jgi:cilia- and flagella-associated protein 65